MLDLKTGYSCNNKCIFCAVKDHKMGDRSFEEYVSLMVKERETNDAITITGGEVTIRKDFWQILDKATELGYKIYIQTNGRAFCYSIPMENIQKYNIENFLVSVHGHNIEIHDRLTGVPNSFLETVHGINNLIQNCYNVTTNTVLMKDNIENITDMCILLATIGVDNILLSYPDITGGSLKNIDRIPTLTEMRERIPEIINVCNELGINVVFDNIPVCIMGEFYEFASKKCPVNLSLLDERIENFVPNTIIEKCNNCLAKDICCHPQQVYVDKFGDNEFGAIV